MPLDLLKQLFKSGSSLSGGLLKGDAFSLLGLRGKSRAKKKRKKFKSSIGRVFNATALGDGG